MDHNNGDDLLQKRSNLSSRPVGQRLMQERSKALELLHTKGNSTARMNKTANKPNASSSATLVKPSTSTSSMKRSPNNKENISRETNKQSQQNNNVKPTQPIITKVQGPRNRDSSKSPTSLKPPVPTSLRTFQTSLQRESTNKLSYDDYVEPRQYVPIDYSALMRSDSISLDSSSLPCSERKDTDVSFHPGEMGGRSTLHIYDAKAKQQQQQQQPVQLTVDEILASSFVADVRNSLCGLDNSNCLLPPSSTSSCFTDFSIMQQNPRPTTLFEERELSINRTSNFSGFGMNVNVNEESFAPAEMMQSKLLQDEISWAKERATVPTTVALSKEALQKLKSADKPSDQSNVSWSIGSLNDPNFSMGRFFIGRSNEVNEIVQGRSPPKNRNRVGLLLSDDTITSTTTPNPDKSTYICEPDRTPVNDKPKSWRQPVVGVEISDLLATKQISADNRSQDSKDSGNATGKWDPSSLSEIEKILATCQISSNEALEILSKAHKSNEINKEATKETSTSIGAEKSKETEPLRASIDAIKQAERMSNLANMILENKENIQSKARYADSMSDTLSFTESLLNTSIQNYRESNAGQARSPLSPIPITIAESEIIANYGDIDEGGNSPAISENRRRRFTKSPRKSPSACTEIDSQENRVTEKQTAQSLSEPSMKSPTNTEQKNATTPTICETSKALGAKKSHSSTRLEGDGNSPAGSSVTLTPTDHGRSVYQLSPLSSSQSENGIGIGKTNCGGGGNMLNPWQYCAAPMRTYSSNSIKSSDSASTRSISRCSNNSEFSHRDGKMPIKATELELSWPSVKLRTDSQKSTKVKNISEKRLVVRIEIIGPGFKLVNPETNNLTLLPEECRNIVVNFSPTMIGPAIGRLVFQPPRKYTNSSSGSASGSGSTNNSCGAEVTIPLYAYGGHASIIIQNLVRGPSGEPFVTMGEFCTLVQPQERSIEIYNKGPLMGFAAAFIEPTRLNIPEISNSIHIEPDCAVIEPRSSVTFRLVFQPNHSDLRNIRKFINKVMTLAKLRIMYGDEAIRQRIRQMQRLMTSEARRNIFGRSLDKLWTRFPGEQAMFPPGVFKDNVSVAQDLWTNIIEQDVAITLDNNMLDETVAEISTIFTEGDNSVLFRTMLIPSPPCQLETVEE